MVETESEEYDLLRFGDRFLGVDSSASSSRFLALAASR